MPDGYFCGNADIQALVRYLGQAFTLGLGVGVILFCAGYGVYMLIDLFRGGL